MSLVFGPHPRLRLALWSGFPSGSVGKRDGLLAFSVGIMSIVLTRIRESCGRDQYLRRFALKNPRWPRGFFYDAAISTIMQHLEGVAFVTAVISAGTGPFCVLKSWRKFRGDQV